MVTTNNILYGLIFAKFLLGLVALAIGIHTSDVGVMIFGAGHAFVLSPLWLYFK